MTAVKRVEERSGTLERPEDPDLVWRGFIPVEEPPDRPALVFVHGLGEHFGRYGFPVDHFTQSGSPCWGIDLRGHGLSDGRRGHINAFDEYLADVAALLNLVRDQHPKAPIFLVGHSMGGVVAILYALRYGSELSGLILSSPGLEAHPDSAPSSVLVFLGRIASVLLPRLHFSSDLDPAFVSRDPKVVREYRQDPLVTDQVTARWATEFFNAQDQCFRQASELQVPTLVMQSGSDRLVSPAATKRWAETLTAPHFFHEWPGLYHEMLNEPEREQVFQLMSTWIDEHLGGRPS